MREGENKLRVLFVIDDMDMGGAQKQVAEAVRRLDRSRFAADVACIERGGEMLERAGAQAEVHVLGARRLYDNHGVSAAARLAGLIRRGEYDVVEAYLPAAHVLSALAVAGMPGFGRRRRRRPVLVAALRNMATLDPWWMRAAAPVLNRTTRFSIANSHAVKQSVVERYGTAASRIAVIPNVIEERGPLPDRQEARAALGVKAGSFAIAAVGTMSAVKDHATIVRAFAQLARAGADATLILAGDGPCRGEVTALGRALGLNGQVKALGRVSDPRQALAAADLFVHASRSEGFSNAVLEAMWAGLPVVASDIPANREALGHGAGTFFEAGRWQECFEAMRLYYNEPARREASGAQARARAARFGGEAVIRRRERLYSRLCEVANDN